MGWRAKRETLKGRNGMCRQLSLCAANMLRTLFSRCQTGADWHHATRARHRRHQQVYTTVRTVCERKLMHMHPLSRKAFSHLFLSHSGNPVHPLLVDPKNEKRIMGSAAGFQVPLKKSHRRAPPAPSPGLVESVRV